MVVVDVRGPGCHDIQLHAYSQSQAPTSRRTHWIAWIRPRYCGLSGLRFLLRIVDVLSW